MTQRTSKLFLVQVRNQSQLPAIAEVLRNQANADMGVIDTDPHGTPRVTPWNPDENLCFLQPLKLQIAFPKGRTKEDVKRLLEGAGVEVRELYQNSLGETETVSAYRNYYNGTHPFTEATRSLATDPWVEELTAAGYTLKDWDDLDQEEQDQFMDAVNLYSEGDLFLSPEISPQCRTLEEARQLHAGWLTPPAERPRGTSDKKDGHAMPAHCSCGDLADFRMTAPGQTEAEELCGRCATLALAPHAAGHRVEAIPDDEEPL